MTKYKIKSIDDNFIMSPKYDFVFKYIFGNEKHKDLLIALLSDVLGVPEEDFEGIEIINSELIKDFKEDKKGILDVRVKTRTGKQIDVEIQILPTDYMAERTIFYWSKMYTSQIKPGDTYDKLKKCVTINIVDFKCTPIKKLYSSYHLTEDKTGYRLTDIIEVHFLEIPKLFDKDIDRDENDPIVQWMEFLDAKSKGSMEMLAQKNKDIKKAYGLLQIISKDQKARMLYEARQAEISDQLTRIKSAEEKGIKKGIEQGIEQGEYKKAIENATNFLKLGISEEIVAKGSGLPLEKIIELKKTILN
ncbi:Rpn family recombination-promoting nuclease/putative transposase [Clostridium estertheticum]|uniref:Rpn family recombination-promoting nuclease/putative transposase n=1 Tax=Clostridium estertheticum TaxID=238834 RepID=UPI001C7D2016|nr:Rpn family recombination-promoting nuclease/putative transposase [Clostridium estertheticum]MBX4259992.1 Rpn family recombination-promoting nuclease/putative transposase [Clostridium estertheticum]WLC72013.1 Rpn family recombination-promoting nuclease/putative transposase [Clostridium estertheticum]